MLGVADETGHARHAANEVPGGLIPGLAVLFVQVHADEHVVRMDLADDGMLGLRVDVFVNRDEDLVHGDGAGSLHELALDGLLHLVLTASPGLKNVPLAFAAVNGFRLLVCVCLGGIHRANRIRKRLRT